MVNFRVKDLDAFLKQLKDSEVRLDDKDESIGRFVWVYDPEENKNER